MLTSIASYVLYFFVDLQKFYWVKFPYKFDKELYNYSMWINKENLKPITLRQVKGKQLYSEDPPYPAIKVKILCQHLK